MSWVLDLSDCAFIKLIGVYDNLFFSFINNFLMLLIFCYLAFEHFYRI